MTASLPKIILFYGFAPLDDPEAIRLWQNTLCESLGLKGRIILSEHGINGTLGGNMESLKTYIKQTKSYAAFKDIDFKWSDGLGDDFPRLKVRVRDEIVTFNAAAEIRVNENGIIGGGKHITPEQVHELVAEYGDEVAFFDGRNAFEAEIGRFKNAVVPDVATTGDFIAELDSGKYDHLKNKPVVTYCTGGIRCEVLSSLMVARGFNDVYQIKGGIVRYGETFGHAGLWEGSLYVFDKRMTIDFSDDAKVLGSCEKCSSPTSSFFNCANLACRKLILLCTDCGTNVANDPCIHTDATTATPQLTN
jgi:UPF0176 protein